MKWRTAGFVVLGMLSWCSAAHAQVDLGTGAVTIVAGTDPIQRNAVQMLIAEVHDKYGKTWTDAGRSQTQGPRIVLALDAARDLGSDGYAISAHGNEVRITAKTSRGLMYGAADLLDTLQAAPLRVPEGDRVETTKSTFRGLSGFADNGGASAASGASCSQGRDERTKEFERYIRYLARLRFNYVVIRPCEIEDAMLFKYVPEIALTSADDKAKARASADYVVSLIRYAKNWGLDVYLSRNEITYPDRLIALHPELKATPPPDADRVYQPPTAGGTNTLYNEFGRKPNLCISEQKTWDLVEAKERELTETFPELAGLTVSTNGTESDIFFCECDRCSKLSKSDRVEMLLRHMVKGMDAGSTGKKLIITPYMGAWKNLLEPEVYIPLAANRLPPQVVINTGAQYGDTYIFNSLNPLVGAFPHNDVIYGFDPAGEYFGGFFGVQSTISRYMSERARIYSARGVNNMAFRNIQYHSDFTDLDWYVGARLAWNPNDDVDKLRRIWAVSHFGAEAGPKILDLLDLGYDVMRKSLYADGINFTNWGLFIESVNRTRHITMDRSAKLADHGMERIAPTAENIARFVGEKNDAFELADQGLRKVDELRGKIPPRQLEGLRDSFLLARELARVNRPEFEAFIKYLQWEGTLSEVDRERLRRPLLDAVARTRTAVKDAQANLATIDAKRMCEDLGMDWVTYKSNKGLFSADPAVTAMDKNIALPYALKMVGEIEERMNYVPASVFGYY